LKNLASNKRLQDCPKWHKFERNCTCLAVRQEFRSAFNINKQHNTLGHHNTLGGVCNSALKSVLLYSLLLLFTSCSVSIFNGYHQNVTDTYNAPVSWFQSDTGHYLFNSKIDLMKNHFSGLMVIKPLAGGIYRVIFITEVGLKIFDMEFFPDQEVKVHYIMDAMNKKALIKTLSNDISLVLMNRYGNIKPDLLHEKASGDVVFRYRDKGRKCYCYVSDSSSMPYRVLQTGGIANKVNANLYGDNASGIDSVIISHYNFRLSIGLYRINEETNDVTE
jgi:hypothetical protein